ncbi:MAG TPA: hypothetical protein VMV83_10675 [Rectinemataceae bacterium]|nr:hypothetical protein [Rectinemataceae bacterium]
MRSRDRSKYPVTIATAIARRASIGLGAGSLAAAVWALASLALAVFGFKRSWPLASLLPAGALFFIGVAWFLYLRGDGFGRKADERPGDEKRDKPARGPSRSRHALVWAAAELLALAAILYSFAGVGRTY